MSENSAAEYEQFGPIAVITMNNPPVNGLGLALRSAIVALVDRALADPQVSAIVLTGGEKIFSAGADIREFGEQKQASAPTLHDVIEVVEACSKPVVAAIAGACLGGGLELAMGCHFRVARSDASLGLPEVKLGLLPGAGGTQRAPRLLGVERALNLIVSGEPERAKNFAGTALLDEVVDGSVLDAAVAFARSVVDGKLAPKRARDIKIDDPHAEPLLQFARTTVAAASRQFPAPLQCVEAVGHAVSKRFDEGLRLEREIFMGLMATPESKALRHIFAAERAVSKLPDVPADTPLRDIRRVGVIGAGTMGGGITMTFADAGIPVVLLETKQEALDRGIENIRRNYAASMKKGKLTQAQYDQRLALIEPTLDYAALADVDLVIEAVFEEMSVKREVFGRLDAIAKPGAILASNTSMLDLNEIASYTKRPQDVIGLHFFSPANVMRLLEIVRGAKTAPDVLATCMNLARRIRKTAVVAGVCEGFIGNRMIERYGAASNLLMAQGASPQQVDGALQRFGLAMGPFRMNDLAGLDIASAARKRKAASDPSSQGRVVADVLCEMGRLGQKTGSGWYRYEAGKRDAIQDPVVDTIIEQFRRENGITVRKISDQEVIERCIYALVNEGARILEDGIAARASDIDVVYLSGYGFPRHRGGPMLYADTVGLPNVVRALRRFAAEPGAEAWWEPAPLLVKLAEAGRSFN
ncbi:3-hydroxyacyl-CoA dehydrogenase NAD-binding domain-containing protein [Paraburkholderia pallida]|uniref:3-hydroxyacyl-CoA dehydrogenase n=1 Tax=Paraburkholderia pallida TaxID=2547399 RepID=A0A4P7D6K7_9BURK|nr:3-hydroxyacyl-CoA dehydrogenase NAD-binding domain-containing protein [Paraburkholderia pallida]QBR04441.1 3-hydroxyacyl-CoA dehydrogenase [Paraburkholderia pallida]